MKRTSDKTGDDTTKPGDDTRPGDDPIAALVNEYFDRREAGETLTSEDFLAEHADLADELKPYLKGLALLDEIRSTTGGADLVRHMAGLHGNLPSVDGYEVLEEIARGGMGVVYKARQLATKRIVALKVMLAGPFASPKAHRRFEREVQLAARLRHPRIVTVLESGQVSTGQKYFAMDHVSGLHLDQYVAQQKPDVRAVLALFIDLCEAVEYAHSMGVIHRDIKPGNILIDANGMPHIVDFGLAKATNAGDLEDSITAEFSAPGQVLGTLRYLSPEQATGAYEEVDVRTDVYALGVVLYEAITGAMPYDTSGRPSEVIRRIIETPPTKPGAVGDKVDAEVSTILLKALEKEQARRYASAKEMGEDIRRYLAGEPILAKRTSILYLVRKDLRRRRAQIIVVVAAIALGIGGVIGGASWTQRQQRLAQIQELVRGRHHVLGVQRLLEREGPAEMLGAYLLPGKYPQLQEALMVFARDRFERDEVDGAILFLNAELGRDPSRWACRELLAEIYRHLEPEDEDQAREFEVEARTRQAEVDRQVPDTAEAWYLRSFTTFDLELALLRAYESVTLDPMGLLAWERIVYLCEQHGDIEGAAEAVNRLIALAPDRPHWRAEQARLRAIMPEPDPPPAPTSPEILDTQTPQHRSGVNGR